MHAQIMPKITEMDSDVIAARRRSQYDKYLQISNRKKVYLDEVDTSEYDPFGFPGAPVLKFKGGAPSNCALKGNDADARLGEDPAKRERNKWVREKELAISLAQGGADPNVVTAVVEGELRKHFNFKRQAKQSTGDGNPHMQISGRNADLQPRLTSITTSCRRARPSAVNSTERSTRSSRPSTARVSDACRSRDMDKI